VMVGEALVRLSRNIFMAGDSDEAERLSIRAVEVLDGHGHEALASATTHHGAMLTLTDQTAEALPVLRRALALATDSARPDLESLGLNYLGLARADRGEPAAGEADLRAGLAVAMAHGCHEAAARAYVNLGELLYSFGEWSTLADTVEAGLRFAAEHGLRQYTFLLELQRHVLLLHGGEWDAAERGLRLLVERGGERSMFAPVGLSTYGRLLARRGRPEAGELLDRAWRQARHQRLPLAMTHAGRAIVEWAWLTGDPERAREVARVLLPRMQSAGWAQLRGELLRHLARAGVPAAPFAGCPEGYAAGLRGDWRTAAEVWHRNGDRYERALELAESGEVEATLEALGELDALGAPAAAVLVRRRLRALGVVRRPRRSPAARSDPTGLTDRQLDVLALLRDGATNAEIAEHLTLSVRTVDHHVAAILARLGVRSRREAVARAHALGSGDQM
jgi:DNA-binding CsgD family transcriptional regulator/tetratricopeptide (TPR) repeat protein